jgi:hypothetical protein
VVPQKCVPGRSVQQTEACHQSDQHANRDHKTNRSRLGRWPSPEGTVPARVWVGTVLRAHRAT